MPKVTLSSRSYTPLYTDIEGEKNHLRITINAFVSLCDLPDTKKSVSYRVISCLLDRLYFSLSTVYKAPIISTPKVFCGDFAVTYLFLFFTTRK